MVDIQSLVGETLSYIDVDEEHDKILLTTQSGRKIVIYHEQDCCENVRIEDTTGDWKDLLGKPILYADHNSDQEDFKSEGTRTTTTLTFRVDDATVISRWVGDSSGYYSEEVDFKEL